MACGRGSWLVALALVACASPRTALVVVVESDLGAPIPLASIHAECGASTHEFVVADGTRPPFSFGVEPSGGSLDPVTISLEARDASSHALVTRRVRVGFIRGRTLELHVHLDGSCEGIACGGTTTCVARACVDDAIDAATLADVVPGRELEPSDAGPRPDVGDVGSHDARVDGDASALPRSCVELPSGSASGVYAIDPDGAGGNEPFDAYCDDGWALIAKVGPSSTRLRYDDPPWNALNTGGAIGTDDLTPGDALRPAYWLLPVHELRIVFEDDAGTRRLVAPLDPSDPTTLRRAMDAPGGVGIDAGIGDWATLGGVDPVAMSCVSSRVPSIAGSVVSVRVGVTASDDASCDPVTLWVGLGATDAVDQSSACEATTNTAGAGRLCNPDRAPHAAQAYLFGR